MNGQERKLYIDVEGVLIGCPGADPWERGLARHLDDFLAFATEHFRCHWLSTHTASGDPEPLLGYLERQATAEQMEVFRRFGTPRFGARKTEALSGDFYWLDDAPIASEQKWLASRGELERLIVVDTKKRPDDLLRAMAELRVRAGIDGEPTR